MDHREAIEYLESLEPQRIRPGLDRIRALLALLGDPHLEVPAVLIGGTNGKGSVSAYLASMLEAGGIPAGLYISPHLVRFEERIGIAGEAIPEAEVAVLASEIRDAIGRLERAGAEGPTYFEATTALAFLHFARRRVPIAVLEVGMGGRFDATNAVEPLACAVTPVAMDHMEWLGRSLREIAHQKAGIMRRGITAVIGPQSEEAEEVLLAEAGLIGARVVRTSRCAIDPADGASRFPDPPVLDLVTPARSYVALRPSLRGRHQVENAAVAVLLAEDLAARGFASVGAEAIARGLERVVWPGRIEIIRGETDVLLDGAHNPAACVTLADYIGDHHRGRRVSLVFAAMKDKPIPEMLDRLCPLARDVVVTALPVARGADPAALLKIASRRHPRVRRADRVGEALDLGLRAAGPGGLCVVSGSLYLVGEIKRLGLDASGRLLQSPPPSARPVKNGTGDRSRIATR